MSYILVSFSGIIYCSNISGLFPKAKKLTFLIVYTFKYIRWYCQPLIFGPIFPVVWFLLKNLNSMWKLWDHLTLTQDLEKQLQLIKIIKIISGFLPFFSSTIYCEKEAPRALVMLLPWLVLERIIIWIRDDKT